MNRDTHVMIFTHSGVFWTYTIWTAVKAEVAMTPGTFISGLRGGNVYKTTVMKDGKFEYNGNAFRSLSAIVREITGSDMQYKMFFQVISEYRFYFITASPNRIHFGNILYKASRNKIMLF